MASYRRASRRPGTSMRCRIAVTRCSAQRLCGQVLAESFKVRLGEVGQRLAKSTAGACLPDLGEVNDGDGGAPDVLAEEMVVIVKDPVADQRDILVPD